jgi:hypothetical protein
LDGLQHTDLNAGPVGTELDDLPHHQGALHIFDIWLHARTVRAAWERHVLTMAEALVGTQRHCDEDAVHLDDLSVGGVATPGLWIGGRFPRRERRREWGKGRHGW